MKTISYIMFADCTIFTAPKCRPFDFLLFSPLTDLCHPYADIGACVNVTRTLHAVAIIHLLQPREEY